MEIKISSNQILKFLQILSWILFFALAVNAEGIIVNAFITLFINPDAKNFWDGGEYLSALSHFDRGYFAVISIIMIIVAVLKSLLFYLIIKMFSDKSLNLDQPFNSGLRHSIVLIAYLSLGIGLFSHAGMEYSKWLSTKGMALPYLQDLHFAGADVWLFMAVILLVIIQILKRGIEIQQENDLTI